MFPTPRQTHEHRIKFKLSCYASLPTAKLHSLMNILLSCQFKMKFSSFFSSFPILVLPACLILFNICLFHSQVYEIFSFKIKSAESAIPKAWILERSIDGKHFEPWQFFAADDDDCMSRYNLSGACLLRVALL